MSGAVHVKADRARGGDWSDHRVGDRLTGHEIEVRRLRPRSAREHRHVAAAFGWVLGVGHCHVQRQRGRSPEPGNSVPGKPARPSTDTSNTVPVLTFAPVSRVLTKSRRSQRHEITTRRARNPTRPPTDVPCRTRTSRSSPPMPPVRSPKFGTVCPATKLRLEALGRTPHGNTVT